LQVSFPSASNKWELRGMKPATMAQHEKSYEFNADIVGASEGPSEMCTVREGHLADRYQSLWHKIRTE
jgi:hypothetical protein